MLYFREHISDSGLLGVWKIEESKEDYLAVLKHHEWLEDISSIRSESRVLEILAVRVLLKDLVGEEKQICYLASGKPYLIDQSFYISISHTKGYVAVVVSKEQPVGIDIEQISEKVKHIQSRFVSPDEYIDARQELVHLLLHWSAKEAMFKFLDVEGVDFKEHLFVGKFSPVQKGLFSAGETRTIAKNQFDAHYWVEKDFVLVCLLVKN